MPIPVLHFHRTVPFPALHAQFFSILRSIFLPLYSIFDFILETMLLFSFNEWTEPGLGGKEVKVPSPDSDLGR